MSLCLRGSFWSVHRRGQTLAHRLMAQQPQCLEGECGESHSSKRSVAPELQMGCSVSADGVMNLVARNRPEEQLRQCHVVELSLGLQ